MLEAMGAISLIGAAVVLAVVVLVVLVVLRAKRRREQMTWIGPPGGVVPRPSPDIERGREKNGDASPFQGPLD